MPKKIGIVALVAVIALGSWLAYYFSDKEVIKRLLVGLAVKLGKGGQKMPLAMAFKNRLLVNAMPLNCLRTLEDLFEHRCIVGVGQCWQTRMNAEIAER